jgi:hypothetical protein
MKRLAWTAVIAGAFTSWATGDRALAQVPLQPGISVQNRPLISPYINLLRNNPTGFTNPALNAINYYGLVQPQFAFQGTINGLQQQVANNQQLITTGLGAATTVPMTGHPAYFLTNGGYFLNNLRGGPTGFAGGAGGAGGLGAAGLTGRGAGGLGGAAGFGAGFQGAGMGGMGAGLGTGAGRAAPRR